MKIGGNCEEFAAVLKRKFLYFSHRKSQKKEQGHQEEIEDLGIPIHLGVLSL